MIVAPEQDIDLRPETKAYPRQAMLRDFVILLSLVNIAYLRVWTELLTFQPGDAFLLDHAFAPIDYLAAIIGILVITTVLWVGAMVARRWLHGWLYRLAEFLFLTLLVFPTKAIDAMLETHFSGMLGFKGNAVQYYASAKSEPILVVALLLALLCTLRWSSRLVHVVAAALLVASPFAALTFAEAAWRVFHPPAPIVSKPLAPILADAKTNPRVIWLVFDEWDYRLTFVDRPSGLSLPAIDRLKSETFFALDAIPPGGETKYSMPSLIEGRRIVDVKRIDTDKEIVRYADSNTPVLWGAHPTVFSRARAAGFNTAVVGYYLPYCRVLQSSLTSCSSIPLETQWNTTGTTLIQKTVNQARARLETWALSPFGQSLSTRQKIETYRVMMQRADAALDDRRQGFVLIHVPVPHAPHAYSRRTGAFTLANHPVTGYVDSLALLDRTLAEFRSRLERSGQWEGVTILATADHPFRESSALDGKMDPRVPFLLKLPGSQKAMVYQRRFHTILLSDLLLAILNHKLTTSDQVATWITLHDGSDVTDKTGLQ